MKRLLFLLVLFFSCLVYATAQENSTPQDEFHEDEPQSEEDSSNLAAEEEPDDPSKNIIEMDIRTSSLIELAAWCRTLGLSEGGTRDDLANRLRSYYELPRPERNASSGGRTIIIESAKTTEYFTLEVVDEEYARLRGDVVISLKDGDATHRIKAREILYNRTRNLMTASGDVEYIREDGNTIETFKGETITVNLDNWASIFVNGASERAVSGNETAYRFSGTVISRSAEEVTVLTGAEITNGGNPDALWSLNASKLWLLPGSDWAVLNAVLKVGNIPVLWLPFFFYPTDELVFHPVMGYRTREGTFLQTTTYILGRPKSSGFTENSITRIFGNSQEGEKFREGLFLRTNTKKTRPSNEPNLSVLFDAYANMGVYLGTNLSLPSSGSLRATNYSLGIGLTRNIYQTPYGWTPFRDSDGKSMWVWDDDWKSNRSNFGFKVPFRYLMEVSGSFSFGKDSLSWNIPLYSDPFVKRDFMNRSEELDWLTMLREGATDSSSTTSSISSYDWSLRSSFNPNVAALRPYVSSFSISSISGSLNFTSIGSASSGSSGGSISNPDSRFFAPNRLGVSFSASMAGSPYASNRSASSSNTSDTQDDEAPVEILLPATPRQPWEDGSNTNSGTGSNDPHALTPPILNQRFTLPLAQSRNSQLVFDYRLAPYGGSELQFATSRNVQEAEDIDWSGISSILTRAGTTASMGLSLSGSGAFSGSLRVNGRGNWQDYSYINKDAAEYSTAGRIATDKINAYKQTNLNSNYDFKTSFSPFYGNPIWGRSTVSYSLSGLIGNMIYDADKSVVTDTQDDPEWKWVQGKWDNTDIGTHQAAISLSADVMSYVQNLSFSHTLEPKRPVISGNATMRAWITETRVQTSILEPYDETARVFRPIDITETLRFSNAGSFQQSVTYNPADDVQDLTSIRSTLNLYGFNASYTASYMIPYEFILNTGWRQNPAGERKLDHQGLNFSYSKSYNVNDLWNKRMSLNIRANASLNFDLQRYTYSALNFGLNMTVGIANFLDLGLSVTSANNQIYRYFSYLPFFTQDVPLPSGIQTNIFLDLLDSFRFDNDDLRRSSGFKLKNFKMDLVHHLGDWNARLGVNLSPYLTYDSGLGHQVWKFNNEISFLIQWVPIPEAKTEFLYSEDKITFY